MILTALLAPDFLCVQSLTSPKAPFKKISRLNMVYTCAKDLANEIIISDVLGDVFNDEVFLAQLDVIGTY